MLHALNTYNVQIFATAMAVGVWILRKRRAAEGLPPSPFQVPNWILFVWITQCVFLLVMPWSVHFIFPQKAVFVPKGNDCISCNRVPPEHGRGDVSFWYATYCVVGLGVLGVSCFNISPHRLQRTLISCILGLWPLLLHLDSIATQMGRL